MKKTIILNLFAVLLISYSVMAQHQPRTINWDGLDRDYLEYVPDSYNPETPAPVVFCLHGLGDNMNNFSGVGFAGIANQFGWIVITPQALMATLPMLGDIGTAWNSGAGIENAPFLGDVILNEDKDDAGFLIAILDSLQNNYNINTDSVFFMGFSMGGFMSNRMAIEHGDRINAIASVSGTIGLFLQADAQYNVNALHFHGTADTQVAYEDAGFDTGMGVYPVGTGAEETVEYWRNFNNCDVEPITTYFPDTHEDGKTFERYLYPNGDNNTYTGFIKIIGGDHEWYYHPQNDIDYTVEIWRFFTDNMIFHEPVNISKQVAQSVELYPNPTSDFINIRFEGITTDAELQIYDISGKIVVTGILNDNNTVIDVSHLCKGMYILKLLGEGISFETKIIKK